MLILDSFLFAHSRKEFVVCLCFLHPKSVVGNQLRLCEIVGLTSRFAFMILSSAAAPMLRTAFRSHHITRTLRLHAAHLVASEPSPPLLSTSTVPQVVSHLVVVVRVHQTSNEIEREVHSRQIIAAELLLQLECSGRRRCAARKMRRVASQDRKHDSRTL